MSDTNIRAQAQLAGFWTTVKDKPGEFPITITDRSFTGLLNLRGDISNPEFSSIINDILGTELPHEANRYHTGNACQVTWLGPDEWMIIAPEDEITGIYTSITEILSGHYAATIVSSAYQRLSISGINARELLSKGCPIDFHPDVFRTGHCVQSRIAKTGAFVIQVDDIPTYDIYVRRSFSDYLALWLVSAAEEYGFNIEATDVRSSG